MATQKSRKRTFNGMSYVEVQRINSANRHKLTKDNQQELKAKGFKNVGWDNVIALYQAIENLLNKSRFEDLSLEDLFLEADRIGQKYQTAEEIQAFNQQLSQEVAEIGELIDQQFPDTEMEAIDFSQTNLKKPRSKQHKTYRTTKS